MPEEPSHDSLLANVVKGEETIMPALVESTTDVTIKNCYRGNQTN